MCPQSNTYGDLTVPRLCQIPDCPLGAPVIEHEVKIGALHEAQGRIETKLDKLMWGITAALGTSVLALAGIVIGLLKR
jgi:hypothetical protein